jgi:hypothetical protein
MRYIAGDSGVKVGFAGSNEPVLTEFGDLYANFMFSGNGGSMEVSLQVNTVTTVVTTKQS